MWASCVTVFGKVLQFFNEHTDEDGDVVFLHACKMGLEGIVSKRLTAPYRSGPSRDWIKVKNPDSPAMIRGAKGVGNGLITICRRIPLPLDSFLLEQTV
jgi:hypothetical protein